jgi:photosystem II stability/assembly factor-like uncharacterized protein
MNVRSVLLSTIVVVATTTVVAATASDAISSSQPPSVREGSRLTDTTLGTGTQLDTVDMLSSSLGFGVASPSNEGRGWFYLVKTTDLGNSWTVQHVLPLPSYVGMYGFNADPEIHFVNAKVGYTSVQNGPLFVTTDGGAIWSEMSVPGIWPTYVLSGDVVSVVSDVCTEPVPVYGPLRCPSQFTQFRLGSSTPLRTSPIPALGRAGEWRAATAMASVSPKSVVVSEGGREGEDSSLLITRNGGRSWNLLDDPCQGLMVNQLLSSDPHRWLLYCFIDGGMNQGDSELSASSNQGASWTTVAHANEDGLDVGDIRDVDNSIVARSDEAVLYGALGGAAGGLEISRDGGTNWTLTSIQTNLYGGAPEYVSLFGSAGAIFGVVSGPQYRSTNGRTWVELPALPAGKYRGHLICTLAQGTRAKRGASVKGIPGTTIDYPVAFTNRGTSACYLNGIPLAQPVGPLKSAVGPSAYPQGQNGRGGFVVLKAHGGVATIVFERQAPNYPRSYCAPKVMRGITIRFAPPSSFYVSVPSSKVCTGVSTTDVEGVVAGRTSGL